MDKQDIYNYSYFSGFWRNLRSRKFHPLNDFRVKYIITQFHPRKIFDAGCGQGIFLERMMKNKVSIAGCDISKFAIEQLPFEIRRHCFVHDIRKLFQLGDIQYNVVSCVDIFEHIDMHDIPKVLFSLTKIANEIVYLEITVKEDIFFIYNDPTHISIYSRKEWFYLLKKMLGKNNKWNVMIGPRIPFLRNGIFILKKNSV